MSLWELFNLRAQTMGQQTVIAGQRGATAQLERVVATSFQTIEVMKRDLQVREEHRAKMSREMAAMEDEIYELRGKLREVRKQNGELAAANTKLIRDGEARRQLNIELRNRSEARTQLCRMARDMIGKDEFERVLGMSATDKARELETALATDPQWQSTRDERLAQRLGEILDELARAPAGG